MIWQPGILLEEMERDTILCALKFYQGSRTYAAQSLGISIRTMRNKIATYKSRGFEVTEPVRPEKAEADEK